MATQDKGVKSKTKGSITFKESDVSENAEFVYLSQNVPLYMEMSIDNREIEMEVIYGSHETKGRLTKMQFLRLLHTFREEYECVGDTNSLDIRKQFVRVNQIGLSNIRVTIEGVSNIQKYCQTNDLTGIPCHYVKKQAYKDPKNPSIEYKSLRNQEYNYRVNVKTEVDMNETDTEVESLRDSFKDALKSFRYKKRFSFLTKDNLFRIDLTAVKTSEYIPQKGMREVHKSFVSSGILRTPEFYELEIEYVGSQEIKGEYPIDEFVNKMLSSKNTTSKNIFRQNRKKGQNIFSQDICDMTFGEEEVVSKEHDVCEFPEMIPKYFPKISEAITSDPMSDIRYEYWVSSDQEWIANMMETFGKHLTQSVCCRSHIVVSGR